MSGWPLFLIFCSLITYAAGQLLFKRAMEISHGFGFNRQFAAIFVPGVVVMTISFFLTLALLQRFDLSYIYPFQGLNVIIISLTGGVLLKEKLTLQLVVGALLISGGVALVCLS